MKKVFKVFAIVAVASFLLSSCKSVKSCPAYSKVEMPAAEQAS